MVSLALSIVALVLSLCAVAASRRAVREAAGHQLWEELRSGAWDVPRFAWRRALPPVTGHVKLRRYDPFTPAGRDMGW